MTAQTTAQSETSRLVLKGLTLHLLRLKADWIKAGSPPDWKPAREADARERAAHGEAAA